METTRIDDVIAFALAAASREDYPQPVLGQIHLLKLVYLGDLAHAARKGESFTGAHWSFYKFGPWSPDVYKRIAAAVLLVGAEEVTIPSRVADDSTRYRVVCDDEEYRQLERKIPHSVAAAVRDAVHAFGGDTQALLHHVYTTPPMLAAAPGEELTFASEAQALPESAPPGAQPQAAALSAKQVKRRAEAAMRALRERVKSYLASSGTDAGEPISAGPEPRYDDVFEDGTAWLDELAGQQLPSGAHELTISDDVWKSEARRAPKLPR